MINYESNNLANNYLLSKALMVIFVVSGLLGHNHKNHIYGSGKNNQRKGNCP